MRYLLLLGWLLLAGGGWVPTAAAQALPDTLHLSYAEYDPAARFFSYCFDECRQPATAGRAASLWAAGRFRRLSRQDLLQAGYQPGRLWLRVAALNTIPQRTHFLWNIYSFVDSATLYVQPDGRGPLHRVAAASSWAVAAVRPFPARPLCLPFWLGAGQRAVYYLRVESRCANWLLFTDVTTTEGFLRYEQNYLGFTYWNWLLGLYLGSVLVNLILYLFLRDRILLWYGGYVLSITWFLLMEENLDAVLLPQAVYTVGWQLGQFSLLLLAQACGLRIMALFVRLRQSWPRLHLLSRWLSNGAIVCAVACWAVARWAAPLAPAGQAGLLLGRTGLLWGLLLAGGGILAAVGWWGRPAQRRLAALYGATYLLFGWGTAELLLNYSGAVYIEFIKPNSLAWCLVAELILLSALLTGRFHRALRQAADQRLRRLREHEAASRRLIAAQDEEREALARELHDALAPGLTALHLAWQGRLVRQALAQAPPLLAEAHAQTEALLRQLRRDVRALSQVLLPSPTTGEQPPLPAAVALLTETLNMADEGLHIEYVCDAAAAEVPLAVQQAAYRIVAELLHNALRHAHAQRVRVEVHRRPTALHLLVADDGRGFDPAAPPPRSGGLGLRGVRARASYLRGQVQVVSQLGQGTRIEVELPV
ncbi:ATP-binding protein [Hymenobacter bucti]|uniref:ATP-binding protein n=1 Tax=Hymenobacter bucti TaxID=1844114 RepID=A0ABW4QNQ2_9BACT